MDATERLQGYPVVPVVVIDDVSVSVRLAETLSDAGLKVIEVTLRTDDALAAIRAIAESVAGMIVGAGSIRRPQQLAEAQEAGAAFVVSPGASDALLDTADTLGIPFIPGAATPSEMIGLYERGYRLQKFFPAELAGGYAYLKSISGPLPEISFMPTGGITTANAQQYLSLKNVMCIGGSWITPSELQKKSDFDTIRRLATDAAHLGV